MIRCFLHSIPGVCKPRRRREKRKGLFLCLRIWRNVVWADHVTTHAEIRAAKTRLPWIEPEISAIIHYTLPLTHSDHCLDETHCRLIIPSLLVACRRQWHAASYVNFLFSSPQLNLLVVYICCWQYLVFYGKINVKIVNSLGKDFLAVDCYCQSVLK